MGQHVGRARQQDGKKKVQQWRQGGRVRVGQHGGGCSKEDRRPEAVDVSQGTQHNETAPSPVGGGTAPMSRVHDKADERVNGTWVGRSLEFVEKRTAAVAAGR